MPPLPPSAAAVREDRARERGQRVRPQDHLAAVAASARRGVDRGRAVDAHRRRGRDRVGFQLRALVVDEAERRDCRPPSRRRSAPCRRRRLPDALISALATSMFSPVTTMVPPLVPFFLPAAESLPATLHGLLRRARGLAEPPVAAPSTIMPLWVPIELASITPVLLMTESTTARAAAAVSSTRPPLA